MSEAADAEREVEDFFNEEIFNAPPKREGEELLPTEQPPEPKALEQVVIDTPAEEEEAPAEETPEGDTPGDEKEETPADEELPPAAEVDTEKAEDDAHLAWARKKYGEDIDLSSESSQKLAKAAFEQEKLLGKKAEETKALQAEQERRDIQAKIDALNQPGNLTPEEDAWVNEALISNDPSEWAYNALQSERPDLYATILDRWAALGETESRQARTFHSKVLQVVTAPQPDPQETYTAALGETFVSLGLNIERQGPLILQKAEELGNDHPAVQGMLSPDADVRRISTRAIYDLVAASNTTVQKARLDDVVQQRVQEEKLRQDAAGITSGGPRIEEPKKSPFWEQFDNELAERGWDGNAPTYGRD